MGLVKRAGGTKILAGEKLRFKIVKAVEDEGDHGPQARLSLEVLDGEHAGTELLEWCKVAVDEETEEQYVADGGRLFNIAMACFEGQVKVIDSFDTIAELLDALEGRSFVSITKPRGETGKYVGITWNMVYTDPDADFENIPF